jgi:hypothetical protein
MNARTNWFRIYATLLATKGHTDGREEEQCGGTSQHLSRLIHKDDWSHFFADDWAQRNRPLTDGG